MLYKGFIQYVKYIFRKLLILLQVVLHTKASICVKLTAGSQMLLKCGFFKVLPKSCISVAEAQVNA